jgi:peptidoglycan glycosyltransferase
LNKSIFSETCKDLLFNKTLPGDFASSKSQMNITKSSTTSDMMMTAIGQGETLVSPYHMCLIASAIANKGTLMKPYLVDHIQNAAGNEITTVEPEEYGDLMTSSEAATLTECMKAVVSSGTGSSLSGAGYSVAGKTGTAEYSTDKDKTHSWFVGFSNTDNPDLAFSVIVEGSDGGTKAVSVVKTILDSYY